MDANGWAIVIAAVGVVLTQITSMVLSYLRDIRAAEKVAIVAQKADAASVKVQEVATQVTKTAAKADQKADGLAHDNVIQTEKLDALLDAADRNQTTTETVHDLVNSKMGLVLKSVAELSEWKAVSTKNPLDVKAANDARTAVNDHDSKQHAADLRTPIEKGKP